MKPEKNPKVNQKASSFTRPFCGVEEIQTNALKAFEFDATNQLIEFFTDQLTAKCPFNGLRDFGDLYVAYHPKANLCIELKSFKEYLFSFEDVGIYQENITLRIYEDLKELLKTDSLEVRTVYKVRGGIETTCTQGVLD